MKLSTKAYILLIVILMQSLTVFLLSTRTFLDILGIVTFEYSFITGLFFNFVGICSVFSIYYIFHFLNIEKQSILKLNHSQEVLSALKAQKHDFKNHLMVINGMLQLDKVEKALEYISKVNGRVDEAFSISKIDNIELAATLYRKCAIAESKGIEVELDISSSLSDLKVDSIDLCKVVFNLLDNAIYELEHCEEEEKILTIDIGEFEDSYSISISNSHPILSPTLYDKIFEQGFSTKGENIENHGFGLNIVKQIIRKNNGKITVESYEGVGTLFTVFFPKLPSSSSQKNPSAAS